MKSVNVLRAFAFAVILYIATFILFAAVLFACGVTIGTAPDQIPVFVHVIYLALTIPLILMLAKWYFRKFQPSFSRGVFLGVYTLVVFYVFDIGMLFLGLSLDEVVSLLYEMIRDWKFYALTVVVLGTTAYAGFEYDRTYTFGDAGLKKK